MQHRGRNRLALLFPLSLLLGLIPAVSCRSSSPSSSSDSGEESSSARDCPEPENPFGEGSGHYAGFEWAAESGSGTCNGKSQSFIEGCEEYENQEDEYQECEAKKRH
jgi:hypothetical protein